MAKKLQVDVNAGEIIESFRPDLLPPVFLSNTPETRSNELDVPEQVVQEKETSAPQKEKKTPVRGQKDVPEKENEYLELFIRVAEMSVRSGKLVYVRKDYHDRILRIIRVIGKGELSLSGYIDHVLTQHFAQYEEEIKKLYKKYYEEVY
jgi:hypothetical protein